MAKAAKAAAAKKPAASARGDKAPAPSKAKVPAKAKGAAAAANGTTAAAVGLKQLAAGLAESHDMPKRQVEAMLGEFVQTFAEHLTKGTKIRINGLGIFQVRGCKPFAWVRPPGFRSARCLSSVRMTMIR